MRRGNDCGSRLFFDVSVGLPQLFVVVKSELRQRGPCGDDDRRQVVCSVVFSRRQPCIVLFHCSPSESELRCPRCGWLSFGMDLHVARIASLVLARSTVVCDEVGVACSRRRDSDDACLRRGDDDDANVLSR